MHTRLVKKEYTTSSVSETKDLGRKIGLRLRGGEVLAFASDLGGGKTTFVGGLVNGFGSSDPVSSPTFTISFVYKNPAGRRLHHFDFYRLSEPGIIAHEIHEALEDKDDIVAIEWGASVENLLPQDAIRVQITAKSDNEREFVILFPDSRGYLFEENAS